MMAAQIQKNWTVRMNLMKEERKHAFAGARGRITINRGRRLRMKRQPISLSAHGSCYRKSAIELFYGCGTCIDGFDEFLFVKPISGQSVRRTRAVSYTHLRAH